MYLQDFRISDKTIYTCNFTPPAALLTKCFSTPAAPACDDVVLHLQSDTTNTSDAIVDVSGENHTITTLGSVAHETGEPKFGSSSLNFPADKSNYLSIPHSSDWDLADQDFTIEFWAYPRSIVSSNNAQQFVLNHYINIYLLICNQLDLLISENHSSICNILYKE